MILLNLAHPLTPAHVATIEALTQQTIDRLLEIPAQFDQAQPFTEQARAFVDSIGLSPAEWQTAPLLVNLPSLNTIAALVLAELHGRMGYFPAIVRMRPVADSTPPQFEVAEILNLQVLRDAARARREPLSIGGV
jgi:hypothetical protein